MMRGIGLASAFAAAVMKLALMTPFAAYRGVYRKAPRRRSPAGRNIIVDRSSSVRKLQRAARRGDIILRES